MNATHAGSVTDLVVMANTNHVVDTLPAPLDAAMATATAAVTAPASSDARRIASAILEVLAGMRSITDVALALGITPARYYALEARAVSGLIAACEPRGPGPGVGAGLPAELDRLRAERDRLKAEAARYQTLARIAQGAFALPVLPAVSFGGTTRSGAASAAKRRAPIAVVNAAGSGRKKRRPTVRALRLATRVRDAGTNSSTLGGSTGMPPTTTSIASQPEDRAP